MAVSDIPIKEIISEVRVARVNGNYIVNPSRTELATADMDFMIGATAKNLMMVEGESKECGEADVVKALEIAHDAIRIQIAAQEELKQKVGVGQKRDLRDLCFVYKDSWCCAGTQLFLAVILRPRIDARLDTHGLTLRRPSRPEITYTHTQTSSIGTRMAW